MALNKKSTSLGDLGPKVLLEETFYVLSKKNSVFRVQLNGEGLCLVKESGNVVKKQCIHIRDIIGVHCIRGQKNLKKRSCVCRGQKTNQGRGGQSGEESVGEGDEEDFSAYLHIYAYILKKNRRERTIITLRFRSYDKFEENHQEALKWRRTLRALINGFQKYPKISPEIFNDTRKFLVLLNPKSGSGKARTIFQQRVAPILNEAEIGYDLNITKYANFAREFIRTHNIFQWKAIVGVGGDGIFFEILNGIFERPDWEEVLKRLPLGIIPCGSGNGLAKSIAHCFNEPYNYNSVMAATMSLVRKNRTTMDLVRVENKSQIMYSFLSIGWGLLADIDIESERIRAIGVQRFTIWSIARLLDLKTYKAKLWYLPVEDSSISRDPSSDNLNEHNLNEKNDNIDFSIGDQVNLETTDISFEMRQRLDSWYSANSRNSAYFSATGSSYQSVSDLTLDMADKLKMAENVQHQIYGPASQIPGISGKIPEFWEFMEGEFVMVHASYQTHLGEDVFFAPNSNLSDGKIWLLILRAGLSRAQLLSFLLGLSTGQHLENSDKNDLIRMVPVQAFRLEPDLNENGVIAVDGEKIEYGPIQAEIFPNLAQIMVP